MFISRNKITNLMPAKRQQELYRRIFSSVEGKMVLSDILIDLCYFDETEDENNVSKEEKNYLRNYANKLLRKCGVLRSENIELIVNALMKLPLKINH